MHATTVAIDLAKDVFELAFADALGRITERKRLSRSAFSQCLANRPPLRVVMEACGSAHHWARVFVSQGHTVRLLPARDVRPYVRGNKTDRADAAGLLEADRCGQIASVAIKTPEQQGVQAQHRVRERLKAQRTSLLNLLRGALREFGIVIALGAAKVMPAVRDALEDGDNALPMALRDTLSNLLDQIAALEAMMAQIEHRLAAFARRDRDSRRHQHAPGVGLLTATALSASAGDLLRFASGRHFAAWLGLTPKEFSSGKTRKLGAITKRGDAYLRTLLIHGARAVLVSALTQHKRGQALDRFHAWVLEVAHRRGHNKAAVAVANKLARRLWAMTRDGKSFDGDHLSAAPAIR
jgi:transposase